MGPWWGAQCPSTQTIQEVTNAVGSHVAVIGMYQSSWTSGHYNEFATILKQLNAIVKNGSIPMFTWQLRDSGASPTNQPDWSYAAILSGKHDEYLARFGDALGAFDMEILVRLFHEMDGNWYPWGLKGAANGNTPAQHVKAWQYIVRLLRPRAPKVMWVWCPDSRNQDNDDALDAAFPGLDYIDYLSCDSYNFGPFGAHGWRGAAAMLDQTKTWFTRIAPATPVIISEIGCAYAPPPGTDTGDKNAWISDFLKYAQAWPQLQGFLWMENTTTVDGKLRDNRLTTPGAAAAFRAGVQGYQRGYVDIQAVGTPTVQRRPLLLSR